MPWLVLLLSAVLEAVWATALDRSDGLTKLEPTIVFAGASLLSLGALAYVARHIPMSVAYASWAGLGAGFTVVWSMISGAEYVSTAKVVLLAGLIGCVVGLKLVHIPGPKRPE